ncbi:hypothetical protein SR70_06670 [Klebsiella aerogenes]|uniref:hypothetical protein n=1 Tax=Klebsiella aerogenes TaxID=548 RepID=UPI0005EECEBE|nr:hypothetical protein [Klebsiella aerogenes]KJP43149.1 hypothetical protein SR70_06670 [Klebsiella aerogenes]
MYRSKEEILNRLKAGEIVRTNAVRQAKRWLDLGNMERSEMFREAVADYDAYKTFLKMPRCPHCNGIL